MPLVDHVPATNAGAAIERVFQDSEDPSLAQNQTPAHQQVRDPAAVAPEMLTELTAVVDTSAPIERVIQDFNDPSLAQGQTQAAAPELLGGTLIEQIV